MEANGGQSEGGSGGVPTENGLVVSAPKFKRRKVSAVRDFSPGCRRVTASNFELCRQIAVDQSSQGKSQSILWLGVLVKFF
ncbi:hypothetical protein J1N35_019188 [Gossypium stocksii]|uniref:Uncharacterized protein n=1 Tax=Gossypium stocksii TaxID=47602 RepID=A0A9D4A7V3_9ROSI|nr:hypothetical protein J1N35_019188 [Gossypium stocksii]